MTSISNNFLTRLIISLLFALPAEVFLFLIRNRAIEEITLYGYVEYTLFVFLSFILLFEGHQTISIFLEKKITWKERFKLRFSLEFLFTAFYTPIITTGGYFVLYFYIWKEPIWIPSAILYYGIGFFISTIFMGFVNAHFVISYWKRSLVRSENLEKENVKAHLQSLQSQLSPHFLFNNFNIVDALIEDKPKLARKYIQKMSEVFRYILNINDSEIVTTEKEIAFVHDYIFLINIRFDNNVVVNINLDSASKQLSLPPASMQLLIENAIKHNEVSGRSPLNISICNEGDMLIVRNSKTPKRTQVEGTGTGLNNLRERYKYLTDRRVLIEERNECFEVKIPLLKFAK